MSPAPAPNSSPKTTSPRHLLPLHWTVHPRARPAQPKPRRSRPAHRHPLPALRRLLLETRPHRSIRLVRPSGHVLHRDPAPRVSGARNPRLALPTVGFLNLDGPAAHRSDAAWAAVPVEPALLSSAAARGLHPG